MAIASSTGRPGALLEIFGRVPATASLALLVAQHMPDKFTRTFAERLDRRGPVRTAEGRTGTRSTHSPSSFVRGASAWSS
ncbi:MAG: chemotaxis protein CheB [Polyangiaceae bacterium]